jgi:acyl-homoserine-lactone acylase
VLFESWLRRYLATVPPKTRYARLWSLGAPLAPRGLGRPDIAAAVLDSAAAALEAEGRALDEPWGETHRLRVDGRELPAAGGSEMLGVLRVLEFAPEAGATDTGRRRAAVGGDGFTLVAGVGRGAPAYALLPFGNATQQGSRHRGDQLERAAAGRLRRAWRDPADVARHVELREVIALPAGLAATPVAR